MVVLISLRIPRRQADAFAWGLKAAVMQLPVRTHLHAFPLTTETYLYCTNQVHNIHKYTQYTQYKYIYVCIYSQKITCEVYKLKKCINSKTWTQKLTNGCFSAWGQEAASDAAGYQGYSAWVPLEKRGCSLACCLSNGTNGNCWQQLLTEQQVV